MHARKLVATEAPFQGGFWERRENKERLQELLDTIEKAGIKELPKDPISQLVHLAHAGLEQIRTKSELESRRSSAQCSRIDLKQDPTDIHGQRRPIPPACSLPLQSPRHLSHALKRLAPQPCPYCPKRFTDAVSASQHITRRHTDSSGAQTERRPVRTDPLQRQFTTQFQALEADITQLTARKAKLQQKLELLDAAEDESFSTLQEAMKVHLALNSLLERQRELMEAHAERLRELREKRTDSSFCSQVSAISLTASTSSQEEKHHLPPRTPPEAQPIMKIRTMVEGSHELVSLGSTVLKPSTSMAQIQVPREPDTPRKHHTGGQTSRRGLFRPSNRYRPLELSYSQIRESVSARVKEKVAELSASTPKTEVMVEKYGLDLCAHYKHSAEDIESTRKLLSEAIDRILSQEDNSTRLAEIAAKKRDPQYSATWELCAKKAAQLSGYLKPVLDFPLKPSVKTSRVLEQVCSSDESLHANEVPTSNRGQHLDGIQPYRQPAVWSPSTFHEGKSVHTAAMVWIDPGASLCPKNPAIRESLISLDFNNSVSFSVLWDSEDEAHEEWRALSLADARRLGLFPID